MHPRILVPFDGSTTAEAALAWAKRLSDATGGTITPLEVVPTPPFATVPEVVAPVYPTEDEVNRARLELHAAAARHGISTDGDLVVGTHIGQMILERARAHDATMIVMGTHGRGVFGRAVLGSVADYVIRHADCPVVTIRPSAIQ